MDAVEKEAEEVDEDNEDDEAGGGEPNRPRDGDAMASARAGGGEASEKGSGEAIDGKPGVDAGESNAAEKEGDAAALIPALMSTPLALLPPS